MRVYIGLGLWLAGCQADSDEVRQRDAMPGDARVVDATPDGAVMIDMAPVVDMAQDPADMAPDAHVNMGCLPPGRDFEDYPRSAIEDCRAVDIFDDATCTEQTRSLSCEQTVSCPDPDFLHPGSVIACCDGERWIWQFEEPDLCGYPPPEDP